MPRLLIVNCTADSLLQQLAARGSRPYDTLFLEAVSRHLPAGRSIESLTLNIGDGEGLPQGVQLGDFDGAWLSGSPLNVYRSEQPTVCEQLDLARAIWNAVSSMPPVEAIAWVLITTLTKWSSSSPPSRESPRHGLPPGALSMSRPLGSLTSRAGCLTLEGEEPGTNL